MATVSLIDPYSQQAEEIARRKRMAQALQEQGSQVLEMPTTPGVLISPYAGLGKLLQAGIGAYKEKQARDDYTKLQNEYRKNYNTQFGDLARAISAPAQEAFAGQEAIEAQPAQMAPKIEQSFGGYGMQREVGQFETAPAVAGQAAIPARPAVSAGYISPKTLEGFDIPEIKQLAMAKYLAQFEPKAPIKGSPGDVFFDSTTGKERFRVPAAAGSTTLSPLGRLQSERDAIFAINPKDPRLAELNAAIAKETKTETTPPSDLARLLAERAALAAKNPTDPNLAIYDSLIAKNTQDQGLAFQREKYEYETANPGYSYERVKNPDGSETIQAINKTTGIARPVRTGTGQALTSAAPKTTPHYSEVEDKGNVVIVDLSLPADERLAKGQIKAPIRNNLEKITTTDASGREVSRYVDKGTLATLGDIPAPYKGFMSDLAEAGQLPANWQSIPQIAGLVRENLINKAGGITQADLANLKVRIAEAAAKLAYEGVPGFSAASLTPALPNFTTLPSQYPTASGAPAANAPKIATRAEVADLAKQRGISIEQATRDVIAKGFRIQ
jgi:hypothetical protein